MSASPVANVTTMSLYGDKESASEVRRTARNERRRPRKGGRVPSHLHSCFSHATARVGRAASLRPSRLTLPPIHPPTQFWVQKYERDARKNWDVFYKNNGDRFFKDRHYFGREWAHVFPAAAAARRDGDVAADDSSSDGSSSEDDVDPLDRMGNVDRMGDDERELGPAPRYANPAFPIHPFPGRVFLEIGCGAGNSAFPLLDLDPTATVFCCDFSPRAVALVERRRQTLPADKRDRIKPFVCDVSREPLCGSSGPVPPGCVDVCTMVFVLSAIAPERMPDVLRNVSSVMRPGGAGRVLLRDYADGDLSQRRLCDKGDGRKLGDNYYVRGDGTRAFYFEKRFVKDLFATQGMALEELTVHARAVTNRADARRMDRRWLQCSFASAHVCAAPLPPPPPPPEPEWRRRAREAEAARAARAAREEEERAAREEEARVEGERARAALGGCDRIELENFLEELRLASRITADEIAARLGR